MTIKRGIEIIKSKDTSLEGSFESETLSLSIGLLGTLLIAGNEVKIKSIIIHFINSILI